MITLKRIPIVRCTTGVYLRWWFNGWHYYLFANNYEVVMQAEAMDTMTQQVYSVISKIERPTKMKATYSYVIAVEAMTAAQLAGFTGLLLAERVEQYEDYVWREVDVTRRAHTIRDEDAPAFAMEFEVTRKELPNTPAVYQKSQYLYLGDVLCELDDDEVIALTKQVNDIAEMQDRQCDFTAEFKIRKSRAMRALFELSGEAGANTTFPYRVQAAKLVIDGIEIVVSGRMTLMRSDDQYYYVAIYSGNKNFFTTIQDKKLQDLTLASANHVWSAINQADSHTAGLDYLYPVLEPSDDGGIIPLTDNGTRAEVFGAWIWPCVKARAIWDEIFTNAGFTVKGTVPFIDTLDKLYIPIASRSLDYLNTTPYLYNVHVRSSIVRTSTMQLRWSWGDGGTVTSYVGNSLWRYGSMYQTPFAATFHFAVTIWNSLGVPTHVYLYRGGVQVAEMANDNTYTGYKLRRYSVKFAAGEAEDYTFWTTYNNGCTQFAVEVVAIETPAITIGSTVNVRFHLPALSQTDFIKAICNLFGLIPDASPRDNTIRFWNYQALYDNIPRARDWSAYLSEHEDEGEFKFGDYAQRNYLRYKKCDDVKADKGMGLIQIDDTTLPFEKDVVELPLATTDDVTVLTDAIVSRVNMNKYNAKLTGYEQQLSIEGRILFCEQVPDGSPVKTFGFRTLLVGGTAYDVARPVKASSLEVAFGNITSNYAGLSHMLTRTSLRRSKFNLPAYEVAGFQHDVPVYIAQYKAYFYVNKIRNYVCGKLCTIEMIKL
jgi:hypothetical protein